MPAMVGMRAEQAEVVVRFGAWMARLEPLEQLEHAAGVVAEPSHQQREVVAFLVRCDLALAGRDPDRGRLVARR